MAVIPLDRFNLLALIVAISAYLAGIRLAGIGRLASPWLSANRRTTLRWSLRLLVLADAPLVIAGLLLTFDLFPNALIGRPAPAWCLTWAYRLFAFAVMALAVLHGASWLKAFAPTRTKSAQDAIAALEKEIERLTLEARHARAALDALKQQAALEVERQKQATAAATAAPPAS